SIQQNVPMTARKIIMRWMQDEKARGTKIPAKAIKQFPVSFRQSYQTNHKKAARWFKDSDTVFQRGSLEASSYRRGGRIRLCRKALASYGRKTAPWIVAVYGELREEFEWLRKTGCKFDSALLRTLAVSIVSKGVEYGLDLDLLVDKNSLDLDGKKHIDKITTRWIQTFMEKNDIVIRRQMGKLAVSASKQEFIE
ncbi:hypothetical protein HDU99_004028, partial [Rhizoclosmatium hyalinum]